MPKNRKVSKSPTGAVTKSRPQHKLRIGNRKSGVSALSMTTDTLKNVLNSNDKSRYHKNARTVLALRGIEVDWHNPLTKKTGEVLYDANCDANGCA